MLPIWTLSRISVNLLLPSLESVLPFRLTADLIPNAERVGAVHCFLLYLLFSMLRG